MTANSNPTDNNLSRQSNNTIKGLYGTYTITSQDRIEVKKYRLSLLFCGISFSAGILHWLLLGPAGAGIWIIPMAISLGLSLKWIHIYLRPLHLLLQLFWLLGCIGIGIAIFNVGLGQILIEFSNQSKSTLLIGPLFASLTGLGFKEFFCFRRAEAIGLTLLLPFALLGHLTNLLKEELVISMLMLSAILLILMAIRKFGMDAAADIGDKSVFRYLAEGEIS